MLVVSTSDSKDNYLWASKHANYYRGCSSSSDSYPSKQMKDMKMMMVMMIVMTMSYSIFKCIGTNDSNHNSLCIKKSTKKEDVIIHACNLNLHKEAHGYLLHEVFNKSIKFFPSYCFFICLTHLPRNKLFSFFPL